MRFYTAIAALTLGVSILGMSDAARADDTPQTHLFARASLGAVAMHGSNGQDRDQAGVGLTTQLDLGVRLLPALRLHGTFFHDNAQNTDFSPRDYYADPLRVTGVGLGATASVGGFELGVSAGPQWTGYMNNREPQDGPVGSSYGWFVSATAGYVFHQLDPLTLGLHAVARYRASTDDNLSTPYELSGTQLGGMLSIGFDGSPVLGR